MIKTHTCRGKRTTKRTATTLRSRSPNEDNELCEVIPTNNVTTPTTAKPSTPKIRTPRTPVDSGATPTNTSATPTNTSVTPINTTSATPTNTPTSTATFYSTPRTSALGAANTCTPKTATPISISKGTLFISLYLLANQASIEAKNDLLWVDKYKPASTRQIIGQQSDKSNVKKLSKWLRNWYQVHGHGTSKKPTNKGKGTSVTRYFIKYYVGRFGQDDGASYKAALLSGPPGVGKTTTASLVCQVL